MFFVIMSLAKFVIKKHNDGLKMSQLSEYLSGRYIMIIVLFSTIMALHNYYQQINFRALSKS